MLKVYILNVILGYLQFKSTLGNSFSGVDYMELLPVDVTTGKADHVLYADYDDEYESEGNHGHSKVSFE